MKGSTIGVLDPECNFTTPSLSESVTQTVPAAFTATPSG
ncbi:hypothetical protein O982_25085 [Mycobacterium avium 10-5581]|nr:hypothetical protein O982_25085 [Mycobacterium avium 10-5581]